MGKESKLMFGMPDGTFQGRGPAGINYRYNKNNWHTSTMLTLFITHEIFIEH